MTLPHRVVITYVDDESLAVVVDGVVAVTVNHDQHGWAGMNLVTETTRELCERLGVELIDETS